MPTATFAATLFTRKTTSSNNFKTNIASQEFYENTYNLVGVLHFSGMNLTGKVISGVTLTTAADKAGFGAGHTKTVYLNRSAYQQVAAGVTGAQYVGAALGTFDGSFYGNTTSYSLGGTLLAALAAYLEAGNNTLVIYNPSPAASYLGYSENYLQLSDVTMTVTYEEGVSHPTVSASSVDLGTAVTINTNRAGSSATHTLSYAFGGASGAIATNVGASVSWTPPLSLALQIPAATGGVCTITCKTYIGNQLTGTASCSLTLNVPASVVPSASVSLSEGTDGVAAQFGCYVRTRSRLNVTVTAAGAQGSSVTAIRTTVNGTVYTAAGFTTGTLNTAGSNTMTAVVTDSRGRTKTVSAAFTVADYSPPSLTGFSAERCNSGGTAPQTDGDRVRIALIVLMALDYISGVMCAVIDRNLSSAVGFRGICKKVFILMLVGVAHIIDLHVVGTGSALRGAVICFYLSNEGLSLLENAAHIGLPVPEKLKTVLAQLHGRTEMEKEDGTDSGE